MAYEVPALSPHLETALQAFRDAGVPITDAELVWLASARERCDHPADGSIEWLQSAPLHELGVDWYPMHRLAERWFYRAFKLLSGSPENQVAAFLFAHARGARGDRTVERYMTRDLIVSEVSAFYDSLPIHETEIDLFVKRLSALDGDRESVPDPDAKQAETQAAPLFAGMTATMIKAFPGTTAEYWETEITSRDALNMLAAVSGGGDFATSAMRTEAIRNWLKAVKTVWRIHQNV